MTKNVPARELREHPDLDQLKRQAKELLDGYRAGDAAATAEVNAWYRGADRATFALHDGQLVIARAYGFESWPKLKAYVEGVTLRRFIDAVRGDDLAAARAMLDRRPELARMSADNLQVLHHAVLNQSAEMVRLLMRHGANARDGIYPHRDATSPLAIADARGYTEIAAMLRDEQQRAPERSDTAERPPEVEAVARGDAAWLQARHAEGALVNRITPSGGLLTVAVVRDRPEILRLLLDFGFDPDERVRLGEGEEAPWTQGMPLWHAAGSGKHQMAALLLERGADPNALVYASGDPVFQAYSRRDEEMIALLERYGGVPAATTAGLYCRTDLARRMLAGEAKYRLDGVGGATVAEQLLWGAACGGDAEIVRLALERVDWPREDARWFEILEQPLRIWGDDDAGYVECFRLLAGRADPNLRGRVQDNGAFGLTILHSIAGSRDHVTPEQRVAFATILLDAGARLDIRDHILKSTPLGWACRWGRVELIRLFLDRGADREEPDAEPWATPRAWAERMNHPGALAALR